MFALNQCADPDRARQALALGLEDFVGRARDLPLARWPAQFWTSLLAQPALLTKAGAQPGLASLPAGPRAALLLRLIAGLDFEPAAHVLGVSQAAYENALRQALASPELDDARMQALRERLHDQVHELPDDQRAMLLQLRERALAAMASPVVAIAAASVEKPATRRPWLPWALAGLALLLALAAWWLWPSASPAPRKGEVLPAEQIAPPPALSDTVIVTHPDYQQLAHPDDEALAGQLALLSWFAAATSYAGAIEPVAAETAPISLAEATPAEQALLQSASSAWAALDAPTRRTLLDNARDWQSRSPAERAELQRRLQRWDRQSGTERAQRRLPFLAWQRLAADDRRRVREAAGRLAGLPSAEQASLREQFAAEPADNQALWSLGPVMGQELAPISSLFAFMPEAERPALLSALHDLDRQARADLALLAPRLTEATRQALRRDLVQAPPEKRAQLIRDRLAQ